MSSIIVYVLLLYAFEEEAYGAEAVVAAYHGAVGIAHPSVVEIALSPTQRFDKALHALPCAVAHPLGHSATLRQPFLSLTDIASVLDWVLVLGLKVFIVCFANGSNLYIVHGA